MNEENMDNGVNNGADDDKVKYGLSKPKKNLRLIILLAVLALTAIGAAGAWYYFGGKDKKSESTSTTSTKTDTAKTSKTTTTTPTTSTTPTTTDPTAGWKTYTNSTHGFNFKYPEQWVSGSTSQDSSIVLDVVAGGHWILEVNTVSNTNNLTLSQAVVQDSICKNATVSDISIGAVAGKKCIVASPSDAGSVAGIVIKGNNIHTVYGNKGTEFDSVLSTFQFTDPTASWKTYTNSTYGFSFKYPSDWLVKDLTSANTHIQGLVGYYGSNPKSVGEDSFFLVEVNSQPINKLISDEKTSISNNSNQELVSELSVDKYGQKITELRIRNKTTNIIFSQDYLMRGSYSYIITGDSTDMDSITQIANQINDTFQFTR